MGRPLLRPSRRGKGCSEWKRPRSGRRDRVHADRNRFGRVPGPVWERLRVPDLLRPQDDRGSGVPGGDPELASILLAGNVLSSVLTLQGECVLHASGIQIDGSALAIVGASGMGKSTITALLCAAGARLISDDVLRLTASRRGTACFAGTSLIRLRPAAAELALLFPDGMTIPTSDGRIGVRVQQAAGSRFQLHAIVIPRPSREAPELIVERLGGRAALVELLRYPRLLGWRVSEPTRRSFRFLSDVAMNVPVFSAEVPWGPPFDSAMPRQLLERVGIDRTRDLAVIRTR